MLHLLHEWVRSGAGVWSFKCFCMYRVSENNWPHLGHGFFIPVPLLRVVVGFFLCLGGGGGDDE